MTTSAFGSTANVVGLAGLKKFSRFMSVGTHCEHTNDGNQSNGSDTTTTSRTKVFLTVDCADLQVLLTNVFGSTNPQPNPYEVTVKAALELSGGTIIPLYFDGARTKVLAAGAQVFTDPLPYVFAKGEYVWLRVNATVGAGDKWPRWTFFDNGIDQFETGSDMVDSGTLTGTNGYSYRAAGLFGRPLSDTAGVAVVGDSISVGSGGSVHYNGFVQIAFGGSYGKDVPHAIVGAAGENLENFIDQSKTVYRLGLIDGCTSALVELGTNSIFGGRTAAQVKADFLTLYARLRLLGVSRIYQTTITPRTSSTDSWVTVGNQTTTNAGHEAVRVDVNAWIRANTAGITGYFETADAIESARDSGKWKANYTADGIHPNDTGHTAMAAAITTTGLLILG